ncbi:MAG: hypothetical protein ABI763_03805 [Bacteroidota bacterium]
MKQYKLIIKQGFTNDVNNILSSMGKTGWRLHSCEQNRLAKNIRGMENFKQEFVLILEK